MWTFIVPIIDGGVALLSWLGAVNLRASLGENAPNFVQYIKFGILLGTLTVVVFSRLGFYEEAFLRSRTARPYGLLRGHVLALLVFILFSYFFANSRISRGTILLYMPIAFVAIFITRLACGAILRHYHTWQDVVLVGTGEPLREYLERVLVSPHLGIRPVGWFDPPAWQKDFAIPTVTADQKDSPVPAAYVISYDPQDSAKIDDFVRDYYNDVTRIYILPTFNSFALLGVYLEQMAGVSVMAINQPHHSVVDLFIKRALDVFGALLGLIGLSPFLLIVAAVVKLTSRGPILFGQDRMGLDGQTFKMWKFRTMRPGPNQPGWTVENDPRRTAIGSFLRTFSVDELPQLWNVLVGDMSLVGPRPEQPFYVGNFRKEIPSYMLRHKMKAGITGWAQVNGWRGNTCLHKRIECDIYYIKNWSLWLDIKILVLTFWKGLFNKNAY